MVGVAAIIAGFLGIAYTPLPAAPNLRGPTSPPPVVGGPVVVAFFEGWLVLFVGLVLLTVGFWGQRKERKRMGLPS